MVTDNALRAYRLLRTDGSLLAPVERPVTITLTERALANLASRTPYTAEGLWAQLLAGKTVSTTFYNYRLIEKDACP